MYLSSYIDGFIKANPKNGWNSRHRFPSTLSSDLTLFINNIDPEISEEKLYKVLGYFGKIIDLKVEKHQERNSFAYLKYDHRDYVLRALDEAQYKKVGKYEIIIMTPANRKKLTREGKLFIKGLSEETLTSDLHKFFEQISKNLYVSVATDENGRHLSTGYVHFFNPQDADKALERLQGKMLNGRKLELSKWLPKEQREKNNSHPHPQNLFISNLHNIPRNELEIKYTPIFEYFGEIQSLVFNENNSSAMLMYKYAEHAQEVFDNLEKLEGCSNLKVNWLKSREELAREAEEKNNRLYINGLQFGVTRELLMENFGKFGQITSLDLKPSGTLRKEIKTQYAVIAYESEEEAEKAYAKARKIEEIKSLFVSRQHVKIDYFELHREKNSKPRKPSHTHHHYHQHHHYPQNASSQGNHFQSPQQNIAQPFQSTWSYIVPTTSPGVYTNALNVSNKNHQSLHQKNNFAYKEESKVTYEKPEAKEEFLDKSSFYENSADISGLNVSKENEMRHNDTFSFENEKQNDLLKKNLNMGNFTGKKGSKKVNSRKY